MYLIPAINVITLFSFIRFMTTKQAEKNRDQYPSKVLHYYNAPADFDEERMAEVILLCMDDSSSTPAFYKFHY